MTITNVMVMFFNCIRFQSFQLDKGSREKALYIFTKAGATFSEPHATATVEKTFYNT
jgi:hypothetical protein